MVGFSKKRKSSKRRGDREMGRGRKKGRGAGLRGGKGRAGSHKHKRVHYAKLDQLWGWENHGFKIPDEAQNLTVGVNVSELDTVLPRLVEMGEATMENGVYTIDLAKMGVDKLLGSGQVRSKIKVTVGSATEQAKAKITEAGGQILAPAA
ncbi:MAG: large subunit ribosomal protein [Thermoplasmata archaeon]|jgi:large subunit ribosomal protein L15|nr:large subunit ribosomal protein [Thermoplasmata archaeon]